jgi:hypothetical protein
MFVEQHRGDGALAQGIEHGDLLPSGLATRTPRARREKSCWTKCS